MYIECKKYVCIYTVHLKFIDPQWLEIIETSRSGDKKLDFPSRIDFP